jgi:uncharacterized protein
MKLSDGEKLIILMLADLQKALNIKGEIDGNFISQAINRDRLWAINWQYQSIPFEPEDDPPAVKQTVDILDMWMSIEEAYADLSEADKKRVAIEAEPFGTNVRFEGFDANHEDHYRIARFLVEDMQRYKYYAKRELNSHHSSVPAYLRMYRIFELMRRGLGNRRRLNANEIIHLLKEQVHHPKIAQLSWSRSRSSNRIAFSTGNPNVSVSRVLAARYGAPKAAVTFRQGAATWTSLKSIGGNRSRLLLVEQSEAKPVGGAHGPVNVLVAWRAVERDEPHATRTLLLKSIAKARRPLTKRGAALGTFDLDPVRHCLYSPI